MTTAAPTRDHCDTPAATGVRPDYDADVDAEVPTDGDTDAVPTGDASP